MVKGDTPGPPTRGLMCALDVARDGILGKGLGPQAQRTGSSSIENLKACGPDKRDGGSSRQRKGGRS